MVIRKRNGILGLGQKGIAWLSKFNIFNQYAGLTPCDISRGVQKKLAELKTEQYEPDLIVVQWTEILFLLPHIQKQFPNVPIISIEEDVSFLGLQRRRDYAKNPLFKAFYKYKYNKVKKLELKYLTECKLVILNNRKDYNLLLNEGFNNKVWIWTPYFQSYLNKDAICNTKNIVFYGAMFREENWRSACWFIEKVLPKLSNSDVRFVIVGGSPNPKLYQYKDTRIQIKGFVEDISAELSCAMCLVAPLVLGAGIKIKVLEALSCGIPVLTNKIGIEGIPAVNKKSYFHCETPDEYVDVINQLLNNSISLGDIEYNSKKLITDNFNFNKDAKTFISILCEE